MLPELAYLFVDDDDEMERIIERIFKSMPNAEGGRLVVVLERLFPTMTFVPVVKGDKEMSAFIFTNAEDAVEFKLRYMGK